MSGQLFPESKPSRFKSGVKGEDERAKVLTCSFTFSMIDDVIGSLANLRKDKPFKNIHGTTFKILNFSLYIRDVLFPCFILTFTKE